MAATGDGNNYATNPNRAEHGDGIEGPSTPAPPDLNIGRLSQGLGSRAHALVA